MKKSFADRCWNVAVALTIVAAVLMIWNPGAGAQAPAQTPKAPAAGNAQNGKKLFVSYGCYQCHGREGQGSQATGPRIGPPSLPLTGVMTYIRAPKGQMPPYTSKVVSDADVADIYAFLQSVPKPPPVKDIPLLNN